MMMMMMMMMVCLQLVAGDFCPGRVNTKPFPKLPNVFSIVGEILDFDSEQVETIEVLRRTMIVFVIVIVVVVVGHTD